MVGPIVVANNALASPQVLLEGMELDGCNQSLLWQDRGTQGITLGPRHLISPRPRWPFQPWMEPWLNQRSLSLNPSMPDRSQVGRNLFFNDSRAIGEDILIRLGGVVHRDGPCSS